MVEQRKKTKKDEKTNVKVTQSQVDRLIRYATIVPSKALEFKKEIRKNVVTAILAAFAFVIALFWRDLIKEGVNEIIAKTGIEGTGYAYHALTALVVTIICVIGIMIFSRFKAKEEVKK